MLLSIRIADFKVTNWGWESRPSGGGRLYLSPGLDISGIDELRHREFGQAIFIDATTRGVTFSRDYLGQYPLLYSLTNNYLYISDQTREIRHALKSEGKRLSLSEEAIALYFSMGYIPQGMTIYKEIVACESATIYKYQNGSLSAQRTFEPIELRQDVTDYELGEAIKSSVRDSIGEGDVDVWCSGGLDSSSMAWETCHATKHAELLTLSYGGSLEQLYGEGEIPYARLMANSCGTQLREARLNDHDYEQRIFPDFLEYHIGPVIDTCVIAKYALAEFSRDIAITGEGGDPLFGGVKNDFVFFAMGKDPTADIGLVYAQSHRRFFGGLELLFRRGSDLKDYVVGYMNKLMERYPGDLLRKMFYLNTFEKQGGMIFPQGYYPGKRYGVSVRHPLTSLAVYEAAFSMPDSARYVYPAGKLSLTRLYQDILPKDITGRKKSGTLMPLRHYLTNLAEQYYDLSSLYELEIFNDEYIRERFNFETIVRHPMLVHALITINAYIHKGEIDNELLSAESRSDDELGACLSL